MSKRQWKHLIIHLLLIASLSAILFPIAVMISTSLKSFEQIFEWPPQWIPESPQWSNYVDVWFGDYQFSVPFFNSLYISAMTAFITILLAFPAAYALSRFTFVGKGWLLLFVLVTQMFSPVVLIVGLYQLIQFYQLLNTLTGRHFDELRFHPAAGRLAVARVFEKCAGGARTGGVCGRLLAGDGHRSHRSAAGRSGNRHGCHLFVHLGVQRFADPFDLHFRIGIASGQSRFDRFRRAKRGLLASDDGRKHHHHGSDCRHVQFCTTIFGERIYGRCGKRVTVLNRGRRMQG